MIITKLKEAQIDQIFAEEEQSTLPHQANIIVKLYKLAIPVNWESIAKLTDYPKCSKNLTNYLFRKFIEFDKKYHPNVVSGGAWVDKGFGTDDMLPDNTVAVDEKIIVYKGSLLTKLP